MTEHDIIQAKGLRYYIRFGSMNLRDFEDVQSMCQRIVDSPINGGLGLKKQFDLYLDEEILLPVRIVPFVWSSIHLVDYESEEWLQPGATLIQSDDLGSPDEEWRARNGM